MSKFNPKIIQTENRYVRRIKGRGGCGVHEERRRKVRRGSEGGGR